MNKKIITIVSSIAAILIIAVGFFFFQSSGKNNIKAEHDKYLALINDTHDFNGGLKGLQTLDNDKGQEAFKNIKTEIKIAKELKNVDSSLDNKDIDSAKKSIDKVDSLTTDNSFDKAIDWLKEDIATYEKAKKEIEEAKTDDINTVIDKYKFNHSSLKEKLNTDSTKVTLKNNEKTINKQNNKSDSNDSDKKTGLTFDTALNKNFEHYYNTLINEIKNDISRKFGASLISTSQNGRDSDGDGIIIAVHGSNTAASGTYTFKYYQNSQICKLIRGIDEDVKTYPAIYNM